MQRSGLPLDEILAKHGWISAFAHPPDVTSLLHDNVAPSPLQTTQLKASLEGLKNPLAEIDSDLDLLRDAVRTLEARRLRLRSLKNDYETTLSPIRRIPSEITMEILRRSWKDNGFKDTSSERRLTGFNVFKIRDGPWHLGQVCSLWRNVIKTLCPELWASMTVEVPFSYEPKVPLKADVAVEILRVVLERSRNHPLDFHFEYDGPDSEADEAESQSMKQCFDIMIAHSRRWRAVEMTIHPSFFARLSLICGKTNLLRDMYFDCYHNPPSGDIRAFEIAPKLENLHLKGMHREASIPFPASNLVSFSDVRPFAGDQLTPTYLDVVKSAPKLRSFSYNDYGVQSLNIHPVPDPPSAVMASSVEEISASSPSFLRSLVLPSLKKATLTTMYDFDNDTEEQVIQCPAGALGALHQMLLQSQCSLSSLRLVDAVLDDNLVNIIRLTPSLQEFVIEFYEWVPGIADDYGAVMQSLVTHLSETSEVDGSLQHSMVPFLQKLTVYLHTIRYAHVSFINYAFVDMVASRVHRPHDIPHLTELNLWVMGRGWSYALSKESEKTLKRLEGEGLRLNFCLDDGILDTSSDSDVLIW